MKEQITRIKTAQLKNNIIISGVPENQWETYETTKARVHDTIASSIPNGNRDEALEEARCIEIVCCTRIGQYQLNRSQPISVTLQRYDDKENILQNKRNLLTGIYINEEYPIKVKKNRDKLCPILKLTKSLPQYREKSQLSGDKLIINGTSYTVDDLQ